MPPPISDFPADINLEPKVLAMWDAVASSLVGGGIDSLNSFNAISTRCSSDPSML